MCPGFSVSLNTDAEIPGLQVVRGNTFCTVTPNICGSSVWNQLFHPYDAQSFGVAPDFWETYSPLSLICCWSLHDFFVRQFVTSDILRYLKCLYSFSICIKILVIFATIIAVNSADVFFFPLVLHKSLQSQNFGVIRSQFERNRGDRWPHSEKLSTLLPICLLNILTH